MELETGSDFCVGQRIKLHGDGRWWDVRAMSDRFVVCTRPNMLHGSREFVFYTVIDNDNGMRASLDLEETHFETRGSAVCMGMKYSLRNDEDCWELLGDLENGEALLSEENRVMAIVMEAR